MEEEKNEEQAKKRFRWPTATEIISFTAGVFGGVGLVKAILWYTTMGKSEAIEGQAEEVLIED